MSDIDRQRLAAILAADAAGYSRLMEIDERMTVAALDAASGIFKAEIESNHGHVINMAGDSVLAVFDTAAGAVTAALAVQRELEQSSLDVPAERRMRFRIGVHLGDVIEKPDGDLYGDGVNIAARLQALAEPEASSFPRRCAARSRAVSPPRSTIAGCKPSRTSPIPSGHSRSGSTESHNRLRAQRPGPCVGCCVRQAWFRRLARRS